MRLIAKTLFGLENILAAELKGLGIQDAKPANRAVIFEGDPGILYKVNYCARTAMSVLMEIAEFRIRSSDDLYQNGLKIEWEKYLDTEMTFSVVPVVHSPVFNHTGYAGLLLKDAIADRFSQKTGKRPSVGTANPDIVFNLHISNDQVTVSVDSSVIPLYKRGYRREQGLAPINEVLAAGIVLLSGWDRTIPLLDPMCGSGTIPVEAALIASRIPPGKFRSYFGFQRWMDYDEDLFIKIKEESEAGINKSDIRISCSDIDKSAVLFTKNNIESAGLSDIISVEQQDFSNLKGTGDNGFIIMNPPYGERMKQTESENLYGMIGTTLKHNFPGYKAFLITSDKEALKKVGLKHRQKLTLYNGSLECVLVKYELYEGSKKNRG